jgi:hypothetical protein
LDAVTQTLPFAPIPISDADSEVGTAVGVGAGEPWIEEPKVRLSMAKSEVTPCERTSPMTTEVILGPLLSTTPRYTAVPFESLVSVKLPREVEPLKA